jgi:hypothetical protein
MACILIEIIGRKEKNVFKTFVNTKIIDFNHTIYRKFSNVFLIFVMVTPALTPFYQIKWF